MATKPIARREALRHLAILSLGAFAPATLLACSKKPACVDVTGLSPEDLNVRNTTAQYSDQAQDATRPCARCAQFVPGPANACGSCKVVKGPINPEGGCKLFVAKPS